MIQLLGAVIPLLERILPDEKTREEAKLKALEMAQNGELAQLEASVKLALGQVEINKVEAGQDNFRGGWRPFCGWICGFGLAYNFLAQPLLAWASATHGWSVPPTIDVDQLMVLLGGMLGLGGLRTYERIKK